MTALAPLAAALAGLLIQTVNAPSDSGSTAAQASAPTAPAPAPSIDSLLQTPDQSAPASAPPAAAPPVAPQPAPSAPASVTPPDFEPHPYIPSWQSYDAEIRNSAQMAQASQGPLDGGWTVTSHAGAALFVFQLADRGTDMDAVEGAWRDLNAAPGPRAVGLIDSISHDGAKLMLRFYETPDDLVVVTVKPGPSGWAGEIWRNGAVTAVSMKKRT